MNRFFKIGMVVGVVADKIIDAIPQTTAGAAIVAQAHDVTPVPNAAA